MGVFNGKIVWVTGAGTGIGKAAATMFAAEGAKVALIGRRLEPLMEVYGEIVAAGGMATAEPLDVADRAAVDAASTRLIAQFGRVDILVNNAGVNVSNRRLEELAPQDWDFVIDVNLTGTFNMVHAVFPRMKDQAEGLIINVASTSAQQVSGLSGAAYSASKFGVRGLSLSLTQEAWKFGIRTCCLCPNEVNTPIMTRRKVQYSQEVLDQCIQPRDLAEAMRFVALMPQRTSIPEMTIYPTVIRTRTPAEVGLPD
ncbi:SDR family oxidoreductase [Bradyrhizobium zhanjiangense]|uniref:SDR family oxidoreductase n=1 Tax=Bradyrhizobium zhanjiangense TaxID=1325107 RepID=A0ABY0DEK6_9BRAD|nr:SDR family oxidoreductase [Bradyrhizobium zhanjiangense]RXG90422.1 SDR family oxidoreductase [Bradyrhizobium zhanjiangense]